MEKQTTEIIEMPIDGCEEAVGAGYCFAGKNGETTPEAIAARQKRIESNKGRIDYRECISCDRCLHSLELRGFQKDEKEIVKGLLCMRGGFETHPYCTCNDAMKSRHGRKKVVYDLENAPKGFMIGMGKRGLEYRNPGENPRSATRRPEKGYIGGSKFYQRIDGERELESGSKMPKGLVN